MTATEHQSHRREELRGLFALGVVAVLAAVESAPQNFGVKDTQAIQLPFTDQAFTFSLFSFINLIIFTWIGYAMLMVFAYSDDIIPYERWRKVFKTLGLGLLLLGPFLFGATSLIILMIAYISAFYPQSAYTIIIAVVIFAMITIILAVKSKYRIVIERRQR